MFKKILLLVVLLLSLLLSACGGTPATSQAAASPVVPQVAAPVVTQAEAGPTPTIDPCLPQYERILAQRVHNHMREFDDASTLAASLTVDKLPTAIADLQRIRRGAEDEPVPACLGRLKELQVAHMNMVINTLMAMLNGAKAADLQTGIGNARQLHDAYTVELATTLGMTVVIPPTSTPGPALTETPPTGATVTNESAALVNMRSKPSLSGNIVAVFPVKVQGAVLGKSTDGAWVQVEVPAKPGTKAWLFLEMVKLTGTLDAVPVVTP